MKTNVKTRQSETASLAFVLLHSHKLRTTAIRIVATTSMAKSIWSSKKICPQLKNVLD